MTDSTSPYWHDLELGHLTADERYRLDQALRAEQIPSAWGGTILRIDAALEPRVATLVAEVRAASPPPPAWPPPVPGAGPTGVAPTGPYVPVGAPAPTNSLAIVSLVLGVVGLLMCQLTGPAGLYCAVRARREIRERGEQGDGLALAGLITSAIATGLLVIVILIVLAIFVVALASA